jgi:hypothetical protein
MRWPTPSVLAPVRSARRAGPATSSYAWAAVTPSPRWLPPPVPETVDLGALPIGRREDAEPWTVRLAGGTC